MGGLTSAFDEPVRHFGYVPRPPRAQHGCVLTLRCRVTWALRRDELRLREAPGCGNVYALHNATSPPINRELIMTVL